MDEDLKWTRTSSCDGPEPALTSRCWTETVSVLCWTFTSVWTVKQAPPPQPCSLLRFKMAAGSWTCVVNRTWRVARADVPTMSHTESTNAFFYCSGPGTADSFSSSSSDLSVAQPCDDIITISCGPLEPWRQSPCPHLPASDGRQTTDGSLQRTETDTGVCVCVSVGFTLTNVETQTAVSSQFVDMSGWYSVWTCDQFAETVTLNWYSPSLTCSGDSVLRFLPASLTTLWVCCWIKTCSCPCRPTRSPICSCSMSSTCRTIRCWNTCVTLSKACEGEELRKKMLGLHLCFLFPLSSPLWKQIVSEVWCPHFASWTCRPISYQRWTRRRSVGCELTPTWQTTPGTVTAGCRWADLHSWQGVFKSEGLFDSDLFSPVCAQLLAPQLNLDPSSLAEVVCQTSDLPSLGTFTFISQPVWSVCVVMWRHRTSFMSMYKWQNDTWMLFFFI